MNRYLTTALLAGGALLFGVRGDAQQPAAPGRTALQAIVAPDQFSIPVPISPAIRAGRLVFVAGMPGFDSSGRIAAGDFAAQMRQAMTNITQVLAAAGAGWDRVAKVDVLLTRAGDFAEMNRIYAGFFPDRRYPARTTAIVAALPQPTSLIEIDCEAVLD